MDLSLVDQLVTDRRGEWEREGVYWEYSFWHRHEKKAASLALRLNERTGQLVIWETGEAELNWINDEEIDVTEHYELTSLIGLNGCIEDLEKYLRSR